jgi:hypothetical protein
MTFSAPAFSESCDFLPPAPQPEWTFESPTIKGYYVGVGLAESAGDGADAQIEKAKQSALNDLASGIQILLKSSLRVDTREQRSADSAITDQDVRRITETIVDTSLKGVEVDQVWLDRKRCVVWVRVKVTQTSVKAMQRREYETARLAKLDALYDTARDKSASAEQRSNALTLAYGLLDEIDFSLLKGQSRAYYQRLLDSLAGSVKQSVGYQQQADQLRQDAERLLLEATKTGNRDKQKQLRVAAIQKLREIIANNPIGEREGFFAAEAAAFKIAELEKARNNSCEAQLQYEIVRDRSLSAELVGKAGELLKSVECTSANRVDRSWRRAFDGVRTGFACASDIQGKISAWDRPCENIESFLKSNGALSGADSGMGSAEVVKLAYQLDKSETTVVEKLKTRGRVLIFVATGKLKNRTNKENPSGADSQFSGKIYSYLLNNGKLEFRDTYTGTGGWNPISGEMALEVLGLNVAKRWKSQYLKHIQND